MALVNIINVSVMDNPSSFTNPFQFEVTFECLQELSDDIEWKVIYVGNAEDSSGDQILEEVMVGPIPIGINRFILQANSPNSLLIKNNDLIGVTVVLITCSYMDNKFVQIGYYVNNEYSEPYDNENLPNPVDIHKLYRNILADEPRVTRFAIDWSGNQSIPLTDDTTIINGSNSNSHDDNIIDDDQDDQLENVNDDMIEDDDELDLAIDNNDDEDVDDDDEEEEDEEEEDDDNAEVDLEEMEEDDDEEDEEDVIGSDLDQQQQQQYTHTNVNNNNNSSISTVIMNDDSMDVERMLQN